LTEFNKRHDDDDDDEINEDIGRLVCHECTLSIVHGSWVMWVRS